MKIVFYVMATFAAAFGVLCLLRGSEALIDGSLSSVELLLGIVGICLAMIWMKRARNWRPADPTPVAAPTGDELMQDDRK